MAGIPEFSRRVYEAVKRIPKGYVSTYKRIAILGNILHNNPFPREIPCHRVVSSSGKLTGAFAFGGLEVQKKLLTEENVEVMGDKVDLKKYLYRGE
jgi:O-6-methylguanine DNA methyltransferase